MTSIDLDQRDFIAGSYAVVPAGCGRDFAVDRRLALRYVMRRDGHLRVTADVNLSSAGPHPVDRIWLASGCATSASVIVCEGPSPQSPGEESYVGSLRSRAVLHQGDEVWIFIAAPPTILFVNVAEVADEAAVGSWCDLRETANVCIDGASCVATATGPSLRRRRGRVRQMSRGLLVRRIAHLPARRGRDLGGPMRSRRGTGRRLPTHVPRLRARDSAAGHGVLRGRSLRQRPVR